MNAQEPGITATIAEFALEARPPSDTVELAACYLMDWFGCALGASRHETTRLLLAYVASAGGSPQAGIIGHGLHTDLARAALVNGTMGHVFDFDDTHLKTVLHPSGPVSAALLSALESLAARGKYLTGEEVLQAFVVAYEVEARVAMAVYPEHYDRGWHITGTAGTFGAAAAAGRVLGLQASQLTQALGLAATQAAGLREMFGTMTKPFHAGNAAHNGLLSAQLAERGFTSSRRGLEAPRGFIPVMTDAPKFDILKHGLGSTWEIRDNGVKPYPCGVVTHPVIDGVLQLRRAESLEPGGIAGIDLRVHPLVLELTGKHSPETGLEAKFSVFHCAAVALVDGHVLPGQFELSRVRDGEVVAVRERVTAEADSGLREDEAVVRITTAAGTAHTCHVEHATGSKDNPLTLQQLKGKFLALTEPIVGGQRARELAEALLSVGSEAAFDPGWLHQLSLPDVLPE